MEMASGRKERLTEYFAQDQRLLKAVRSYRQLTLLQCEVRDLNVVLCFDPSAGGPVARGYFPSCTSPQTQTQTNHTNRARDP